MKKSLSLVILGLFIIPAVFSLNLDVQKVSENEVMISGVDEPVMFNIQVENKGSETTVEFYNLVGMRLVPSVVHFDSLEKKTIQLEVSPIGEFNQMGAYRFNYYIRDNTGEIEQPIEFNIVELKDTIKIGASSFNPESNLIMVYVENTQNFNFKDVNTKFVSQFFDVEKKFDLASKEKKNFSIEISKEDLNSMLAGFYTMDTKVKVDNVEQDYKTSLEFEEKDLLKTTEENYGFVINTKIITKSNEGNVVADAQIVVKKTVLSRLFTTFSPAPDNVNREGGVVTYTWSDELGPGESIKVSVKTNWLFPLILVIIVLAVVIITKQYTKTDLVLKKKVSFVRAKGGEFAIKVSLYATAKGFVENVIITDRLPMLVKLYEQFGTEKPSKVNEKARLLEWNFPRLESGEVRTMSYILYSKVGVLGKFALPAARAIFERNGKIKESESNRAFFLSEQKGEPQEEYS